MKLTNQNPASTPLRPHNRKYSNAATLASDLLPLCDVACVLLAMGISIAIYSNWVTPIFTQENQLHLGIVFSSLFAPFILYDQHFGAFAFSRPLLPIIQSYTFRFALFGCVVLALLLVLTRQTGNTLYYDWLASWLMLSLILTVSVRLFFIARLRKLKPSVARHQSIAIVGDGLLAGQLVNALQQSSTTTVELVGIFDDVNAAPRVNTAIPRNNLDALIELNRARTIDWILLALPPTAEKQISTILEKLKPLSVPIALCPLDVGINVRQKSNDYLGDQMLVTLLADQPIKGWNGVVKTVEDYLFGTMAMILLSPVLVLISLAIKLDSPGPVIFKQRRHTLNNREFDIYKFRTMRWEASTDTENLRQTTRQDNRVTTVGRFLRRSSLDELPQIINVLKGEMSLVGPRPHAINMRTENHLGHEISEQYAHRHRVKPGISGWSQVNGARGATDTIAQLQRRVELDLHYIENWSLWLDLKILLKTFREVIKQTNAF